MRTQAELIDCSTNKKEGGSSATGISEKFQYFGTVVEGKKERGIVITSLWPGRRARVQNKNGFGAKWGRGKGGGRGFFFQTSGKTRKKL